MFRVSPGNSALVGVAFFSAEFAEEHAESAEQNRERGDVPCSPYVLPLRSLRLLCDHCVEETDPVYG